MSVLSSFLWIGVTSAYFMPVGKVEYDNELLKLWYRKWDMISTFSLTIFIGISVFCEAFLVFNLLSSFTTSSCEMKLKLKVMLLRFFIRLVIAFTLGWFLYLFRAISTSLKLFSVKVALSFSVSIPKFLTVLTKYSLNTFAILISLSMVSTFSINLIVVLALTLIEKRGLTFCQNFLLSKTEFTSRFAKWSFFGFF